ncbi:hypothetical protein JQR85_16475 [Stutzerimonas urumqiensis]|uniref:LPS-assembly lipoprotein LptE n=1 Tax=Stutzerimonas urumqiensis TaxID=638269 RepID=UPI000EAF773D|nr:LPS assembly lipoprotein LptE [Stutzerimonas urumqiensis]
MNKRNLAVLGLAALLAGCGFQLRGTGSANFALDELSVEARDAYGPTVDLVEKTLERNGVRVHPGAPYDLHLVRENNLQRTASYTSAARSAEHLLIFELDYQVRGPGGTLLIEEQVEVQKVSLYDQNNLIGATQEAEQIRQELRREAVTQLMMRLRSLTPAELDALQATAEARAQAEAEAREAERRREAATPASSPLPVPFQ